ncbi:unnamed protein product [Prorocentrum cordatum]|uniref:Ion transport domain-containing protein n=1 Tax=Prorocentrum cordatum TaxID=2364126 RepID=A0ABN9TXX0_9DINO|nr:unnamed protein product [Polarella glacialis]
MEAPEESCAAAAAHAPAGSAEAACARAAASATSPSAEELRRALARAVADAFQSLHRAQDIIERELPGALASALHAHGALEPCGGGAASPEELAAARAHACHEVPGGVPERCEAHGARQGAQGAAGPRRSGAGLGPVRRQAVSCALTRQEVPGVVPECGEAPGWSPGAAGSTGGGPARVGDHGQAAEGPMRWALQEWRSPGVVFDDALEAEPSPDGSEHPAPDRRISLQSSSSQSSAPSQPLALASDSTALHQRVLQFKTLGKEHSQAIMELWKHLVKSLQEISVSEISQIHSAWTDAKTLGIMLFAPQRPVDRSAANLFHSTTGTLQDFEGKIQHHGTKGDNIRRVVSSILNHVCHPFTRQRIAWDFMGMALCLHDVTMFPAEVFELPEEYLRFRFYYEFLACVFWTIDVPINFSTGYISMEGLLEMRKGKVMKHYGRTWATPDVVVTLLDWICLLASVNNSGFLRLGKAASRTMRSLRLLRLPRLSASLNEVAGAVSSEAVITLAGVAKLLLLLILVTHYVACMWFWLADTSDERRTWKTRFLSPGDYSQPYEYLTAMHWAITQFTPASMEVHPMNVQERLFTCVVIVVAMVFFSSFVSSITHAMTNLRAIHVRKIEQEMFMAKYFGEFRISRELASRCRHFITQHQRMASRRIKGTDIPFSNILPKFINEDLRCEALIPFLKSHPFFDFYMVICPVGMRQICCNATEEISMLPQEELFWNGQPVNRMFFVRVGSVSYTDDNTDIPTLEVKVGQWACEETLWSKVSLVSRPFTASTLGCEMITVLPSEFHMVSRMHPYPLRFCISYAKLFINAFNNASKNPAYRNLLFNDSRECTNLVFNACVGLDDQGKLKKHFGTKLGLLQSTLRIAAFGEDVASQSSPSASVAPGSG